MTRSSPTTQSSEPGPHPELTRRAGVRDLLLGLGLLGVGVITGGSALAGGADRLDYAFDGLALLLIGWGLFRLLRR